VLFDENGSKGVGSAPKGETLSCREVNAPTEDPNASHVSAMTFLRKLKGSHISQIEFDEQLVSAKLHPSDTFALSSAFFDLEYTATQRKAPITQDSFRLCFNLLNGGDHAYTNPVKSDFPEFLVVPPMGYGCRKSIDDFVRLNDSTVGRLKNMPLVDISGNRVGDLGNNRNRDVLGFLNDIKAQNHFENYGVMVDASATDLWSGGHYRLSIAEERDFSREAFVDFWLELIEEGDISYLEDPFHEHDEASWERLANEQHDCILVGDNLHSGDFARFTDLVRRGIIGAIVLKPDQAMTITATDEIVRGAKHMGIEIIMSHRSISTDSTFLSKYMLQNDLKMAKFGPLLGDFSAILKINALLRD
jgi:enolase